MAHIVFVFIVITEFLFINAFTSDETENIKPIYRYLKGNLVKSCKWCNMKPEKYRHDVHINRDVPEPSGVIDLFDIPVFAAMAQDKGRINRQILSDVIGRLH